MSEANPTQPFRELFQALDMREQRKAMRSAVRRVGKELRKMAETDIPASGLGAGTRKAVAKSLRLRVYPARYGVGFMITTKPHGKEGFHKNRAGKEKPVLMWAAEGTRSRYTRGSIKRSRQFTGRMHNYDFLPIVEARGTQYVETNLLTELRGNLDKALRKKKLL